MDERSRNFDKIMETTTPFDLTRAIQIWRDQLTQSPAFRGDNLDELELHLRDAIGALQTLGLSEEEALCIAARRLGNFELLGGEFGKLNTGVVWRDRALWMMAGMLCWTVAWDLSRSVASGIKYLGSMTGAGGFSLGWLSIAAEFMTLGLVAVAFWLLVTGRLAYKNVFPRWMMCRPVFLVGGILLLKLAPGVFETLSIRNLTPLILGQTYIVTGWFNAVGSAIVMLSVTVIFTRLSAKRNRTSLTRASTLVLATAISLAVASAQAQTTHPAADTLSPNVKVNHATLDQSMKLWQSGSKEAAVAKFLTVDFSRRPLFSFGSVLNYTEAQFIALPPAAREKLAQQMNDDLRVIKEICAQVRDNGKSALAAGDAAKSGKCMAQLNQCGDAFNQPDSLALLKLVGKALQKMAARTVPAPPH